MLGRSLSLPLWPGRAERFDREVTSPLGDLPVTPDPRAVLRWSIAALALMCVPVILATAGPLVGPGVTYGDVVALCIAFVAATIVAIVVPWERLPLRWLVVLVGLPVVFVSSLTAITGAGASPYGAIYGPILAIAGWYLPGRHAIVVVGLVVASELWRAIVLDGSRSIEHLAVALPFDLAIAAIASLASRWLRASLVQTRRDQVRLAATLDAIRELGSDDERDVLVQLECAIGRVFDADTTVLRLPGGRPPAGLAAGLVDDGVATVLVSGAHRVHGLVRLEPREPLSHHDLRLAAILAEAAGRTLDSQLTLEAAKAEVDRDALTGLLNRRALDHEIAAALDPSTGPPQVALLFADLDNLKDLNDVFGHVAGDAVLVHVAAIMRAASRRTDRVYRFGGDEFAVLVRGGSSEATRIAERVMVRAAAAGRRVGDVALPPFQLSIGIAVQSAGMTPASFLAAADEAMYAAKRAGGNRINVVGATVVAHGYESSELARGPMVPGRHDD